MRRVRFLATASHGGSLPSPHPHVPMRVFPGKVMRGQRQRASVLPETAMPTPGPSSRPQRRSASAPAVPVFQRKNRDIRELTHPPSAEKKLLFGLDRKQIPREGKHFPVCLDASQTDVLNVAVSDFALEDGDRQTRTHETSTDSCSHRPIF